MEVHGESARDSALRYLVDYIVDQSELKRRIIEADQCEIANCLAEIADAETETDEETQAQEDEEETQAQRVPQGYTYGRAPRAQQRMRAYNHIPYSKRPCFKKICKNNRTENNIFCYRCQTNCTILAIDK